MNRIRSTSGVLLLLLAVLLLFQCEKKVALVTTEVDPPEVIDEPVSYDVRTDRDDIPPKPITPWWAIHLDELTPCQANVWAYLELFYPIEDPANPAYEIYTLDRQNHSLATNNHLLNTVATFFTLDFPRRYLNNPEYNCARDLSARFFEEAIGEPTCVTNNYQDSLIIYQYHVKMRFRHGPCPMTYRDGESFSFHCSNMQTQFCSTLMAMFSMETGALEYLDFRQ